MGNNALYFPYINVPNNSWFFHVLLYWDKISSIVPYDYAQNNNSLAPFMQELVTAGLVQKVIPSEYTYKIPRFEEAFLEYIQSQLNKKRVNHQISLSIPSLIHLEKMGRIAEELVGLGLARRANYSWYEVENWAASDFMCYLASTLGKIEEINADPVTNSLNYYKKLSKSRSVHNQRKATRAINRDFLLDNILPSPIGITDINKLIKFKLTYGKKLSVFRNTIENYCIDLSSTFDEEEWEIRKTSLLQKITDEVEEISDAMKSNWERVTFKTIIPILGVGANVINNGQLITPLGLSITLTSLACAVYEAYKGVADYERILNKPLAYAALTRNQFSKFDRSSHRLII